MDDIISEKINQPDFFRYRRSPLANRPDFSLVFSIYATALVFVPAQVADTYPKDPAQGLEPRGVEGVQLYPNIILVLVTFILITYILFDILGIRDAAISDRITRASLITVAFLSWTFYSVIWVTLPWLYGIYALSVAVILSITFEVFQSPLVPEKASNPNFSSEYAEFISLLVQVLASLYIVTIAFTIPFFNAVIGLEANFIILIGLPSIGYISIVITFIYKRYKIITHNSALYIDVGS